MSIHTHTFTQAQNHRLSHIQQTSLQYAYIHAYVKAHMYTYMYTLPPYSLVPGIVMCAMHMYVCPYIDELSRKY